MIQLLFAFVAITVLVVFCPRVPSTHYTRNAHKGHTWEDKSVVAPVTFDVYKSEQEKQQERDSIYREIGPYYHIDEGIKSDALAAFETSYAQLAEEHHIPARVKASIVKVLGEYYTYGIMNDDDYRDMRSTRVKHLNIYNDRKEMKRHDISEVSTVKNAYEDIRTSHPELRPYLQYIKLNKYLLPNLTLDSKKTESRKEEEFQKLDSIAGTIQAGQIIVEKNQIVSNDVYNKLVSLEMCLNGEKYSRTNDNLQLVGQIVYISFLVFGLLTFFIQFRSDYLEGFRFGLLVTLLCLIFPLATYGMVKMQWLQVYILPFSILPIYIRVFMDSRTAFITHMTCVMLSAIALRQPFEFVGLEMVAGLVAIYSLRQLTQRSELFRAIMLVTLTSLAFRFCTDLMRISALRDLLRPEFVYTYIYIGINGVLLLISYLLLFPVERLFHFTSSVTLVELSNINNPLLRALSEKAPGTFQHSMQVGNLAAEVANKIGAKSLLVRTGALYHDIGKVEQAHYFTENQKGYNPLSTKSDMVECAQIIINHVSDGLALASKHNLPDAIKDFIRTHHGTNKAKYFYITYKNAHPDETIDESLFTYPGPMPNTTEQAILMMADAVEAASRSLKEYTEESIQNLVDKIIDGQMHDGCFNHCPITFKDITTAKRVFAERLKAINHTRIQYPELNSEK